MANITYDEAIEAFEYRDGELFWKIKPHGAVQAGDKVGGVRNDGYVIFGYKQKRHRAHRIIFLMHNGFMPDDIDHIDGNRSNNKIENLRSATRCQNQYNKKMMKNNKSGVRCVSWDNSKNKWAVYVNFERKRKFYGYFEDLEIAALVANEVRDKLHGEFARAA